MSTFIDSLDMARKSIESMVTFMHSLVPLLMTLMMVTGSITTSNLVQPIILFLIQFFDIIYRAENICGKQTDRDLHTTVKIRNNRMKDRSVVQSGNSYHLFKVLVFLRNAILSGCLQ